MLTLAVTPLSQVIGVGALITAVILCLGLGGLSTFAAGIMHSITNNADHEDTLEKYDE
jgi:hypothetical protein